MLRGKRASGPTCRRHGQVRIEYSKLICQNRRGSRTHSNCIYLRFAVLSITAFFLGSAANTASAQTVNFVPEVDTHLTLNSYMRTYLQAKDDRDEGASDQLSIGPSVQFYLKPLLKLRDISTFDLNDARHRVVVLELGYRYLTAPNTDPTNRMEPILTFHFPLRVGFLLTDRNRADLDWQGGKFNWRYRNKVTIDRTVAIRSYHFIPYLAAEPYYVDKYHKWSTTDLYAGCQFPFRKHVQLNAYYEHENNTGKKPNQSVNDIGLALNLYFSLEKQ
jgi:Protein of unknown function (DUF2490)